MWSNLKFGPVVQEEMSFKSKFTDDGRRLHYGRQTKSDHNTSPWAFGSGELKHSQYKIQNRPALTALWREIPKGFLCF